MPDYGPARDRGWFVEMGVVVTQAGAAVLADPAGADDAALVEAVRRGDDRAFEELYARYLAPITGFVTGRVHDHARAEDIAQDVFVSALRRIRATESAIAFRPWIYEIARNACIDAYRRGRRAEQVPLESERLAPADRDRLVSGGPAPEAAVAVKEELDHLRGAFGSLSDVHHEILVLRELEGLSYDAIGERLGMTKAAVESTLFRARRRLGEEYEGIASGERCASVQGIVADAAHRRLGVRDRRRVTSHAAHCDPCRRLALAAGFEIDVSRRRRVARRLGAWLPIPGILRRGGEQAATAVAGRGGWMGQLPGFLEPGWGKAVAGVAALAIAGAGAGVTTSRGEQPSPRAAAPAAAAAPAQAADAGRDVSRGAAAAPRGELRAAAPAPARERVSSKRRERPAAAPARRAGARRAAAPTGRRPRTTARRRARAAAADPATPRQPVREATDRTRETVRDTTDRTRQTVRDAVDGAGDAVKNTVDQAGQAVQQVGAEGRPGRPGRRPDGPARGFEHADDGQQRDPEPEHHGAAARQGRAERGPDHPARR